MNKSLRELKAEAIEAATKRGHKLGEWDHRVQPNRIIALSRCERCRCYVACDTNPKPTTILDVSIGGTAIELNCIVRDECQHYEHYNSKRERYICGK